MAEPTFTQLNDAFNEALLALSRLRKLRKEKCHCENNKEKQLLFAIDAFLFDMNHAPSV